MQFQAIIDMENPDLFRWLTGQAPVPDEVRIHAIRARARACPCPCLTHRACALRANR